MMRRHRKPSFGEQRGRRRPTAVRGRAGGPLPRARPRLVAAVGVSSVDQEISRRRNKAAATASEYRQSGLITDWLPWEGSFDWNVWRWDGSTGTNKAGRDGSDNPTRTSCLATPGQKSHFRKQKD